MSTITDGTTRAEHLAWCKQRALDILDSGDADAAVASMLSDLNKWREPLYDQMTLTTLAMDAVLFRKTADQLRDWINGFN